MEIAHVRFILMELEKGISFSTRPTVRSESLRPAVETERYKTPLHSSQPGARAMPPLPGVGERLSPRATWSCIDKPLKPPGRSRSASLPTPVKGRISRHRLLRAPGMSKVPATPPSRHRSQGCADSPAALFLATWICRSVSRSPSSTRVLWKTNDFA